MLTKIKNHNKNKQNGKQNMPKSSKTNKLIYTFLFIVIYIFTPEVYNIINLTFFNDNINTLNDK